MDASRLLKEAQAANAPAAKFDERPAGSTTVRTLLRSALLLNAFIFVKSMLFSDPAANAQVPGTASTTGGQQSGQLKSDPDAIDLEAPFDGSVNQAGDDVLEAAVRGRSHSSSSVRDPAGQTPSDLPDNIQLSLFNHLPFEKSPHASNDDFPVYRGAKSPKAVNLADAGPGGSPPNAPVNATRQATGPHDKTGDETDDADATDETGDGADPQPVNRAPVLAAGGRLRDGFVNQAIVIAAADLLRYARDPEGDALIVTELTATGGTVTQLTSGLWRFTPTADFTGQTSLHFVVSDGEFATPGAVLVNFNPLPGLMHVGTNAPETIIATAHADVIDARAGDDIVDAREGDDVVIGGAGDDRLIGGEGNDVLYGGAGNDVMSGGAGNDILYGGSGDDLLVGGGGNDILLGEDGDDFLFGEDGDDALFGEAGSDHLNGGAGNDILNGGAGDDVIAGGPGDDVILASIGDGNDVVDGGEGADTLDLSQTTADAVVDLAAGFAASTEIGEDVLTSIENVTGGAGNDALSGDGARNHLNGGAGNDILDGGAGDDVIAGGAGDDVILAALGDGNDVIDGGEGSDTLDLSETIADAAVDLAAGTATSTEIGEDVLTSIENVTGGAGNDVLSGDGARNQLNGGAGNDILDGGAGDDVIAGGAGDDVIVATIGDGNDVIDGGEGSDTLDLSETTADAIVDLATGTATSTEIGTDVLTSIENVTGGAGNDSLYASEATNMLSGGAGDDNFVFRTTVEAGYGYGHRSKIMDFEPGDKINFKEISREFDRSYGDLLEDEGIKKFVLVSSGFEFSKPGQIRYAYDEANDVTVIQGNINYDANTEFEIELAGLHNPSRVSFHDEMFD